MKKLNSYKDKAKWVTISSGLIGAVMCVVYQIAISQAQAAYYDTLDRYSSLTSYASEKLAENTAAASVILLIGVIALSIAGVAAFMWAAANLLIAYKTDDPEEE